MVGAGGNDADRRASEREIEFLAASESHFPPLHSRQTDTCLSYINLNTRNLSVGFRTTFTTESSRKNGRFT